MRRWGYSILAREGLEDGQDEHPRIDMYRTWKLPQKPNAAVDENSQPSTAIRIPVHGGNPHSGNTQKEENDLTQKVDEDQIDEFDSETRIPITALVSELVEACPCESVAGLKGQEAVGNQQENRPKEERTDTAYEDDRCGHSSDALGDLTRVLHA